MKFSLLKVGAASVLARGILTLTFLGSAISGTAAPSSDETRVVLDHHSEELGIVDLGSEVTQTAKGPMRFVGRIVDAVKRETADGCHLALAITNTPRSPNLHVLADGKLVAGFDDVVWHSLTSSSDGKHFAFVANRDGKQVCVRDGKPGQAYTKIGRMGSEVGSPLVFSPDGQHLGFAAQNGGKWQVVIDEVAGPAFDDLGGSMLTKYRKPLPNGPPQWRAETFGGSDCPQFTADSRHFFYLAQRKNPDGPRYIMVLDGKPGPAFQGFWGAHLCPNGEVAYVGLNGSNAQVVFNGVPEIEQGGSELIFSADGKRHAYIAGKARSGALSVVVDGKQGQRFNTIDNLQFSPDGHHVSFNTYSEDSGYRVVVDGSLVAPVDGFRISRVYFSGDGKRTVFLGEKSRDAVGDKALIENGKVIAAFPSSYWLVVSPDGRRVAYSKITPDRGIQIVLDGVAHPAMASIDFEKARFSADSQHFSYVGQDNQQRSSVIVDGVAGPKLDSLAVNHPVFSAAGDGYAYAGKVGADWVVVANGVIGPKLTAITLESLTFSSDGRQVAYIANIGGLQTVVRTTTSGPHFAEIRAGSLAFSPDAKHLAYVATNDDENGSGRKIKKWRVVIDGVPGPNFSEIGPRNVIFSSDSRHWGYIARQDRGEMLVINGVAGPRFSSIEAGPIECGDGRLEYMCFNGDGEKQKLVRVTVKGFGPVRP